MTAEDFKRAWSTLPEHFAHQMLVTYSYDEMAKCLMQQNTKEFLNTVGLPAFPTLGLAFNEKISFSTLENLKTHLGLRNDDFARHYVIGSSDNTSICIDANNQDKIVMIDIDYAGDVDYRLTKTYPRRYRRVLFMNNSVRQLAECLLAFSKLESNIWVNKQELLNQKSAAAHTADLEMIMKNIDPDCLNEDTFWWMQVDEETLFDERFS